MPRPTVWLVLLWTLFVLYPNPLRLITSAQRAISPVIDPRAVAELAATLPDDPEAIEALVNSSLVPYAVPWQTYGEPWYFPTPQEVLAAGQGDCQGRAVVFASILHAKGIPATLSGSFDHLWVEYPRKPATQFENAAVAIVTQRDDGGYQWQWPQFVAWRESWAIERAYFWDAMPTARRWLLVIGWIVIGAARTLPHRWIRVRLRRRRTQPALS